MAKTKAQSEEQIPWPMNETFIDEQRGETAKAQGMIPPMLLCNSPV